jgi:hypothetical protein
MTMIAAMATSFSPFHRRGRPREDEEQRLRTPSAPTDCRFDQLGELVVGEVEAFLTGRLIEDRVATGRPVPAWAVLNRLAHGAFEGTNERRRRGPSRGARPRAVAPTDPTATHDAARGDGVRDVREAVDDRRTFGPGATLGRRGNL